MKPKHVLFSLLVVLIPFLSFSQSNQTVNVVPYKGVSSIVWNNTGENIDTYNERSGVIKITNGKVFIDNKKMNIDETLITINEGTIMYHFTCSDRKWFWKKGDVKMVEVNYVDGELKYFRIQDKYLQTHYMIKPKKG